MADGRAIRFQPYPMIRYLLSRLGCMMILVGAIVLVLGVAAECSGHPAFDLVLIGIAVTFIGFLIWNKLRKKQRSTRFSLFRKRRHEDEEDQDDSWEDQWYD
jgi:drug/metabolite transporter (DMT)-like permease